MEAFGLFLRGAVSFLGGIRATVFFALLLLALAGAKFWQHKAHALSIQVDTAKAALAVEQERYDALAKQLADAKGQADKAKAEKDAALKAAAKRLAAREKEWERVYGAKPENRAWADQRVPADIYGRLRDH